MKQGDRPVNEMKLEVLANDITVLTCATSPDRSVPEPNIKWYIGNSSIPLSNSKMFALTAEDKDNNQQIYCEAYNTEPADAVKSPKSTLYVKGKIPEAILCPP